jgi:hypothetical protein
LIQSTSIANTDDKGAWATENEQPPSSEVEDAEEEHPVMCSVTVCSLSVHFLGGNLHSSKCKCTAHILLSSEDEEEGSDAQHVHMIHLGFFPMLIPVCTQEEGWALEED